MMRKIIIAVFSFLFILTYTAFGEEDGNYIEAISAEQAFDAQTQQIDPETQKESKVAIVDIRSVAEYHWVGAPAKVDMIVTTDNDEIKPYMGKVLYDREDRLLFSIMDEGKLKQMFLSANNVSEIFNEPIAINIPFEDWDDDNQELVENTDFKQEIEKLADEDKYNVLILMCRSGKRTSKSNFDFSKFNAVYEIDGEKNGRGGFQGSSYDDIYNGYRGWPGRQTPSGDNQSVSWSDSGLPIHIGGWKP
jgi:rhodanese-related sulfurtransferase